MPQYVREDVRSLSGPEKTAVLLMALGEKASSQVFAQMDEGEIRTISRTMASLGTVSSGLVERLFVEFTEQLSTTGSLVGSRDTAEKFLRGVLRKDQADNVISEIRGPRGRTTWEKLAHVSESTLATYLKAEHPQTVAVVLSKLPQDHTAKVLTRLPEHFATDIIMRMIALDAISEEVLQDVEKTLKNDFMSNLAPSGHNNNLEMMAGIFGSMDRVSEQRFLRALEERNREAAAKIKSLMFTFEDLQRLDAPSIQLLLRYVDKEQLAIALRGATESLRNMFFANMSERAAKILSEDMNAMGPLRLRDVERAQTDMVELAKMLADRGEVVIRDERDPAGTTMVF